MSEKIKEVKDMSSYEEIQGLDTDNLSEEERGRIYQEMEQAIIQTKPPLDSSKFLISNAPNGIKMPLLFNLGLIITIITTLLVVPVILTKRSKNENINTLQENNIKLAQNIISKRELELESKNKEIEEIRLQLENLQNGQIEYQATYKDNITNYKNNFENDLKNKQSQLRTKLANQNLTENEIQRQLRALEIKLRQDFDKEFNTYKQKQENILATKESEYNTQISSLQSQYQDKQKNINILQQEISQKEEQLNARNKETETKLSQSQQRLQEILNEKNSKQSAFRQFNIYHQNIISLAERGNFKAAKSAISTALQQLNASPYANDQETKTYKDAYQTYTAMIDAAISAQKILDESNSNVQTLTNKQTAQAGNFIELQKKFNDLNTRYTELLDQIDQEKTKVAQMDNKLIEMQNKLVETKQESINSTLTNMRLIIGYLSLKQAGVVASESEERERDEILDAVETYPLYRSVINSLTLAIEPNGTLKFFKF